MMRTTRKILVIPVLMMALITVGCVNMMDNYLESQGKTTEAVKEQMLQHMFDKYGVEFVVIDFEPIKMNTQLHGMFGIHLIWINRGRVTMAIEQGNSMTLL
jgi:PBP1b-binding outer membrane lipoprotein LpoB